EEIGQDYTDVVALNGNIYSLVYNSNENLLSLFDILSGERIIRLPISELYNMVVFDSRYFVFEDNDANESIVFDIIKRKIIFKSSNCFVDILGNHIITY
ncbi:MAG: hypothetical protein Q8942_14530, partial [Bacillota bacterium]|nr:hypothetical protein [Bacillota bacterium]